LKVKLGRQEMNDLKAQPVSGKVYGYIPDTVEPRLFRSYELQVNLPGTSRLQVDAMDHDFISHELIGTTIIDLEDRLFDERWKTLGVDAVTKPKPNETKEEKEEREKRFRLLPTERRALWNAASSNSQGTLECWLDIMTPHEVKSKSSLHIDSSFLNHLSA
jgi:hypothetical protein